MAAGVLGLLAVAPAAAPASTPSEAAAEAVWRTASARLGLPLLRPADPAGLRIDRIRAPRAGSQLLDVTFRGARDAYLRVLQGPRHCCGGSGDASLIGRPALPGGRGRLYRFGEGPRPDHLPLTLYWRRGSLEIGLVSSGVGRSRLLAFARSMTPVPGTG